MTSPDSIKHTIPEEIAESAESVLIAMGIASTPTNSAAIISALLAERQSSQWQPIDTAPKDRTGIILALKSGRVTVGHWLDNSATKWPWVGWSTDAGPHKEESVTHWQPLPPAPTGEA